MSDVEIVVLYPPLNEKKKTETQKNNNNQAFPCT